MSRLVLFLIRLLPMPTLSVGVGMILESVCLFVRSIINN